VSKVMVVEKTDAVMIHSLEHWSNAVYDTVARFFGKCIDGNDSHPWKARSPMVLRVSGSVTEVNAEQPEKTALPM